jgi:hypothetical protein
MSSRRLLLCNNFLRVKAEEAWMGGEPAYSAPFYELNLNSPHQVMGVSGRA